MANQVTKRIRVIAAAVVATLAATALFFQPSAATADQDAYLDRTAYCLDLLFSDPIAHAQECGGGPAPAAPSKSLSEPVQGAPAKPVDPCNGNHGGSGNAGNAGVVVDPCLTQGGQLAPFIAEWIWQIALGPKVPELVPAASQS